MKPSETHPTALTAYKADNIPPVEVASWTSCVAVVKALFGPPTSGLRPGATRESGDLWAGGCATRLRGSSGPPVNIISAQIGRRNMNCDPAFGDTLREPPGACAPRARHCPGLEPRLTRRAKVAMPVKPTVETVGARLGRVCVPPEWREGGVGMLSAL